jgi:uncharacterized protein (TIRG00374 family)
MRTRLLTWVGVALSAGLVLHLARRFDLDDTLAAARLAAPGWLAAGAAVYALLFGLRGRRWAMLLEHLRPVSTRTATEVFAVGFLANNVLPARLGDVARAFVLARREGLRTAGTFSSVMLERIFDGVTVVALMSAVLWAAPPATSWIGPVARLSAAVFVGAILACALVAWNPRRVEAALDITLAWLPRGTLERLHRLVGQLGSGLHSLKSAAQTARVAGLSLAIWLTEAAVYVLVARAYDLEIPLPGLVLVMSVLTLGLSLPSAPAFVGVFEGLVVKAVEAYGVTGARAMAFAVTMHAIHFVVGSLIGLLAAYRSGLNLRDLRSAADRANDPPAEDAGTPARAAGP